MERKKTAIFSILKNRDRPFKAWKFSRAKESDFARKPAKVFFPDLISRAFTKSILQRATKEREKNKNVLFIVSD